MKYIDRQTYFCCVKANFKTAITFDNFHQEQIAISTAGLLRCSLRQNRTWEELAAFRQPRCQFCSFWLVFISTLLLLHITDRSRMQLCHLTRSIRFNSLIRTTMSMLYRYCIYLMYYGKGSTTAVCHYYYFA